MARNKDGTIKKGATLNPNGRPKGSRNKLSIETRDLIQSFISKELESIGERIEELEPKERLDVLIKLLPYIVPKQKDIEANEAIERSVTINLGNGTKPDTN